MTLWWTMTIFILFTVSVLCLFSYRLYSDNRECGWICDEFCKGTWKGRNFFLLIFIESWRKLYNESNNIHGIKIFFSPSGPVMVPICKTHHIPMQCCQIWRFWELSDRQKFPVVGLRLYWWFFDIIGFWLPIYYFFRVLFCNFYNT